MTYFSIQKDFSPTCLFLLLLVVFFISYPNKLLTAPMLRRFLPYFFLRIFMISGLMLKSNNFKLFLWVLQDRNLIGLFCIQLSNFFNTIYWSLPSLDGLCHKLICAWVIYQFVFCSIGSCVYFKGSNILFLIILVLYYSMKSGCVMPSALCFFLRIALDIQGFHGTIKFRTFFFFLNIFLWKMPLGFW